MRKNVCIFNDKNALTFDIKRRSILPQTPRRFIKNTMMFLQTHQNEYISKEMCCPTQKHEKLPNEELQNGSSL